MRDETEREIENYNDGTNTLEWKESQKDTYLRYVRDIRNNGREIINILARETLCNCMDSFTASGKEVQKLGTCFGCRKDFEKEGSH